MNKEQRQYVVTKVEKLEKKCKKKQRSAGIELAISMGTTGVAIGFNSYQLMCLKGTVVEMFNNLNTNATAIFNEVATDFIKVTGVLAAFAVFTGIAAITDFVEAASIDREVSQLNIMLDLDDLSQNNDQPVQQTGSVLKKAIRSTGINSTNGN